MAAVEAGGGTEAGGALKTSPTPTLTLREPHSHQRCPRSLGFRRRVVAAGRRDVAVLQTSDTTSMGISVSLSAIVAQARR